MKRLALLVLLFLFTTSSIAFADSQHLYTGGYRASGASSIKYIISGSPGSSYDDNIIKPAAYNWNFITTNASLTYNSNGAKMSVFVASTPDYGVFGACIHIIGMLLVGSVLTMT